MHEEGGTGFDGQFSPYNDGVEEEIGFGGRKREISGYLGSSASRFTDASDILAIGLEKHILGNSGSQMKMENILKSNGCIFTHGTEIRHAHKDKEAVSAVDGHIGHAREIRFAIYVDGERFAVFQPDTFDNQSRRIAIIDLELQRRTTLLRDDGIEGEGIGRERQTQRWIIAWVIFFTTKERYGAYYEKQIFPHYSKLKVRQTLWLVKREIASV